LVLSGWSSFNGRFNFRVARFDTLPVFRDQAVENLTRRFDDLLSVFILNVQNATDFVCFGIIQLFRAAVAVANENLDIFVVQTTHASELCCCRLCDFGVLGDREDVDAPTRKLCCQTDILASTTDRFG
jgi:hypothetical protein